MYHTLFPFKSAMTLWENNECYFPKNNLFLNVTEVMDTCLLLYLWLLAALCRQLFKNEIKLLKYRKPHCYFIFPAYEQEPWPSSKTMWKGINPSHLRIKLWKLFRPTRVVYSCLIKSGTNRPIACSLMMNEKQVFFQMCASLTIWWNVASVISNCR